MRPYSLEKFCLPHPKRFSLKLPMDPRVLELLTGESVRPETEYLRIMHADKSIWANAEGRDLRCRTPFITTTSSRMGQGFPSGTQPLIACRATPLFLPVDGTLHDSSCRTKDGRSRDFAVIVKLCANEQLPTVMANGNSIRIYQFPRGLLMHR